MRSYFLHGCSVLCLLVLPAVTHAEDRLQPRAEVGVKAGSERSVLTTEFWAPLAQKSDRVVYADVRLMGDNDENREGNLGFGYRQIYAPTNSVLGVHGWIDRRRTEYNNTFHAVTLGVESLGSSIDLRANGYIALGGSETAITPNLGPTTPYLAGTGLFYNTNGSVTETPQHGVDAEAGYRLPIFEKHVDTLRVFGGSYHFFRSGTDNVTGIRIRTEAQINPALSVGARFQHDGPRGSQGFLEATLKFPFSAKKMFQKSGLRARLDESPERDIDIVTGAKVDNGQRQITNSTTGDAQRILYVDNTNTQSGDGSYENPFNNLKAAEAALKANDILYVRSGNGTTTGMDQGINITQSGVSLIGSGSALTVSSITFLNAGTAPTITNTQTFVDDGVTIASNYYGMGSLTGNGVMVTADNAKISGLTIRDVTGSGVYLSANAGQTMNNITVNNNTIYGSVNGSGVYIRTVGGGDIGNVDIRNNNLNDTSVAAATGNNRGVMTTAIGTGSTFGNIIIDSNTIDSGRNANAIELKVGAGHVDSIIVNNNYMANSVYSNVTVNTETSSADPNIGGLIDNITISNNTSILSKNYGILVTGNYGSHIGITNINDNNSSSNTNYGIYANIYSNSSLDTVNINNNLTNNNKGTGTNVTASSGSTIQQVNIQNLTSNGNINNGVTIYPNGTGSQINNLVISNVNASNNTGSGININSGSGGILNVADLSNITTSSNGSRGFYIFTNGSNSSIGQVNLSNSLAFNNTSNGIALEAGGTGGSIGSGRISDNTVNGNNSIGIRALSTNTNSMLANLEISNNTVNNNNSDGISINPYGAGQFGTITINSNIANGNNGRGIGSYSDQASRVGTLTISNNTANNNRGSSGDGIFVTSVAAGTVVDSVNITGNITINNAARGINTQANNGSIGNLLISGNTASQNGTFGIILNPYNSGQIGTATISNNIANSNKSGVGIQSYGDSGSRTGTLTLSGNTTNANSTGGIFVGSNGTNTTIDTVNITGNTAANNTSRGINASATASGILGNITISNNTSTGNTSYGISLGSGTSGTITSAAINSNTANSNGDIGVLVSSSGSAVTSNVSVTNNTANNNTGVNAHGFQFYIPTGSITNAIFSGNTATGNSLSGLSLYTTTAGSLSVFNNNLIGNTTNGINLNATTGTYIIDLGGGSLSSVGGNRIFNNTGTEVRVDSGYALQARNNYWGGGDLAGGERTLNGGATITTTGYLVTDPRP